MTFFFLLNRQHNTLIFGYVVLNKIYLILKRLQIKKTHLKKGFFPYWTNPPPAPPGPGPLSPLLVDYPLKRIFVCGFPLNNVFFSGRPLEVPTGRSAQNGGRRLEGQWSPTLPVDLTDPPRDKELELSSLNFFFKLIFLNTK